MRLRSLLCCLCLILPSGCIVLPFAQSVREAGLTKSDRISLLGPRIGEFHQALYWGDPQRAMSYVKDEARNEVAKSLLPVLSKEKVVETKVGNIEYDEGAHQATVTVLVKSYRVPVYVVGERTEKERWSYSFSDGWMIESREEQPS